MHEVTLLKQDKGLRVLMRRHIGSYMEIGQAFGALQAISPGCAAGDAPGRTFGMYLDDTEQTEEAKLRSIACVTVPDSWQDRMLPDGFEWGDSRRGVRLRDASGTIRGAIHGLVLAVPALGARQRARARRGAVRGGVFEFALRQSAHRLAHSVDVVAGLRTCLRSAARRRGG